MDQAHSLFLACLTSGSDPAGLLDQIPTHTAFIGSLSGLPEHSQALAGNTVQNSDPSQEF